MKIGASIMVRNMAPFIGATIRSLSWVDGIYVFDDNSVDGSGQMAESFALTPIVIEKSIDKRPAFERGEREVRNYIIDQGFDKLQCDVLISIDADELMDAALRPFIENMWQKGDYDSICLTTWHLYTEKKYIHFWETQINGIYMIDPHTRVITRGKHFEKLIEDGSHPIIWASEKTLCLHGPYHFHLKYFHKSPYPNYSLNFLPKRLTEQSVKPFLQSLPFDLSSQIQESIAGVEWEKLQNQNIETPHYDDFQSQRIVLEDPSLALRHPKDVV